MRLAPGSPSVQSRTPQLLSDFTPYARRPRAQSRGSFGPRVLNAEVPTGGRCPTVTDVADALSFVPFVSEPSPTEQ